MTWHNLLMGMLVAFGPIMLLIHLYSRRLVYGGKIHLDDDEGLIYARASNGKCRTFTEPQESMAWILTQSEEKAPFVRVEIVSGRPSKTELAEFK